MRYALGPSGERDRDGWGAVVKKLLCIHDSLKGGEGWRVYSYQRYCNNKVIGISL